MLQTTSHHLIFQKQKNEKKKINKTYTCTHTYIFDLTGPTWNDQEKMNQIEYVKI